MHNPLTLNLERFTTLNGVARQLLDSAVVNARLYPAGTVVAHAGERTCGGKIVLRGVCCQSQTLLSGRRQIVSVMFPGETTELLTPADYRRAFDLAAVDDCIVASLSPAMTAALKASDEILRGLLVLKQIEVSTAYRWLVNASGSSTDVGLAFLLCELRCRMERFLPGVDLDTCKIFNQTHLAEMMGKTHVHINRTLQIMRSRGLIDGVGGKLFSFQPERLGEFCDFDADYLHMT